MRCLYRIGRLGGSWSRDKNGGLGLETVEVPNRFSWFKHTSLEIDVKHHLRYSWIMKNSAPSIHAKNVTFSHAEPEEILVLTGGLTAHWHGDSSICLYPVRREGKLQLSLPIPQDDFRAYIKVRNIAQIGIKQITKVSGDTHWRWAPAVYCRNPPDNNPCYQWQLLLGSITRAASSGERYPAIVRGEARSLSQTEMEQLAKQARHIAICLHQMNFAMVSMAEHFQNELSLRLSSDGPCSMRYSHIRGFDLASYVHSFFQAYGAARDHYAHFLAVQALRHGGNKPIDDMSKLLRCIDPEDLKLLPMIAQLVRMNFLGLEHLSPENSTRDRLSFSPDTWLSYANKLRRRFTHHEPYGTVDEEEITEIYAAPNDPSVILAKGFLAKGTMGQSRDLLRTTNYLYQNICGLFLTAAKLTGYMSAPVLIKY